MIINETFLSDELITEIGKFAVLWNWIEGCFFNNDCSSGAIKAKANPLKTM